MSTDGITELLALAQRDAGMTQAAQHIVWLLGTLHGLKASTVLHYPRLYHLGCIIIQDIEHCAIASMRQSKLDNTATPLSAQFHADGTVFQCTIMFPYWLELYRYISSSLPSSHNITETITKCNASSAACSSSNSVGQQCFFG